MNLRDPKFWLKLQPGSVVTLKDEKSLLRDMSGVETMIKRVLKLPESEGLCTWLLFELEEATAKATRWLMVKIVDAEIDFRIYRLPPKFERGNRYDLVFADENNPGHWIFQEPEPEEVEEVEEPDDDDMMPPGEIFGEDDEEEPEGIVLNDLVYTDVFDWNDQTYRKKAQGDFACGDFNGGPPVVELPKPSGIDYHQLATLAEYIADNDKAEESEALVFEIGDADDDNGGLISLMVGYPLVETDLDILAK
jgi:hypothetical protein